MGKRKARSEISDTLIHRGGEDDATVHEEEGEEGGGFFACYLLTSLSPRFKGQTYIGFTVNPRRRIRQHNGEIMCGARRTKSKRPWEMVLCIYGFPTNVAALQFEWAWQHPKESLAVRKAAADFKSFSGIANKMKLAYTMLTLPTWQSLNLTVNFFSTKYTKHSSGCPSLPEHMKVQVGSMDELPCYTGGDQNVYENDEWDDDKEGDRTGVSYGGSVTEGLSDVTMVHNSADHQNRECDETGGPHRLNKEKPADTTGHSSADHRNSFEKTTTKGIRYMEENGLRQRTYSPIQIEPQRQCFSPCNSPRRTFSFATSSYGNVESVEDRDLFRLIDERSVELVRPTSKQLPNTTAVHSFADHRNCSEETTTDEGIRYMEENVPRQQRDSPIQSEDQRRSLCLCNSPPKTFSFRLIDERSIELVRPARKQLPTTTAVHKDQLPTKSPTIPSEVEVIDLFTPSPSYRINSRRMKRGVSFVCPKVIDLTKSPIFV